MVADAMGIEKNEVCSSGNHPQHVKAWSLLCYWAVPRDRPDSNFDG
jgi:hypothetical protein